MGSFHNQLLAFNRKTKKNVDQIFREAFVGLADAMQAEVPRDTHFLMSSLDASKSGIPPMRLNNPAPDAAPGTFKWDREGVIGVASSAKTGDTLYLGYQANYAVIVHEGHEGREPQPWVRLVAQRWRSIVAAAVQRVKDRPVA